MRRIPCLLSAAMRVSEDEFGCNRELRRVGAWFIAPEYGRALHRRPDLRHLPVSACSGSGRRPIARQRPHFRGRGIGVCLEPRRAGADRHAARMAGTEFRGRVPELQQPQPAGAGSAASLSEPPVSSGRRRILMGAAAVGLHLVEARSSPAGVSRLRAHFDGHRPWIRNLGFSGSSGRSPGPQTGKSLVRQVLGTALLFIFIGTYVHVGLDHGAHTWSNELVLHHASVPLALFIILHNHRFVLLDALIRFCANAVLAGLFTFACLTLIQAGSVSFAGESAVTSQGVRALGICLLLLLFALVGSSLQKLLTRIVFRRGDSATVAQELRSKAADLKEEPAYLSWALDHIASFMRSDRIRTGPENLTGRLQSSGIVAPALCTDLPELRKSLEDLGVEVIVPLRFSGTEVFFSAARQAARRSAVPE